ncbi:hypothetical protein, partial [Blastomonas fulva]|uniref:hypothetical protein n=1 Tax=Blastomonas fulva TaxID=1550728 RepID=UPI0040348F6E
MHNPAWKTFNVPELDQDAVVLLFDLLYESLGVFKKQYWLGVITMQVGAETALEVQNLGAAPAGRCSQPSCWASAAVTLPACSSTTCTTCMACA